MPSWREVLGEIQGAQDPYDRYRRVYLNELHNYTERDVLLYSSGWTHTDFPSSQQSIIDADMQGIMEAFSRLDGDELDLILHSPGGSPGAAESIVDYIRSKYEHVRVLVPHAAMSAGTMICCASDELMMGRHSFVGPIDPQITLDTPTGHRPIPAGAILSQFKEAKEEIREDDSNLAFWTPILRQYGPGLIQECNQAMDLSKELAEEWARQYMLSDADGADEAAESLAEELTDYEKFKIHNRHLHRDKARELGMEVSDLEDDDELQDLVLTIYHATTLTHDNHSIAKIIETHQGNTYMAGSPPQRQEQQSAIDAGPSQPPDGPPQPENTDF